VFTFSAMFVDQKMRSEAEMKRREKLREQQYKESDRKANLRRH